VISGHSFVFSGRAVARADDLRQARELAILICSSEEAIQTFLRITKLPVVAATIGESDTLTS